MATTSNTAMRRKCARPIGLRLWRASAVLRRLAVSSSLLRHSREPRPTKLRAGQGARRSHVNGKTWRRRATPPCDANALPRFGLPPEARNVPGVPPTGCACGGRLLCCVASPCLMDTVFGSPPCIHLATGSNEATRVSQQAASGHCLRLPALHPPRHRQQRGRASFSTGC